MNLNGNGTRNVWKALFLGAVPVIIVLMIWAFQGGALAGDVRNLKDWRGEHMRLEEKWTDNLYEYRAEVIALRTEMQLLRSEIQKWNERGR